MVFYTSIHLEIFGFGCHSSVAPGGVEGTPRGFPVFPPGLPFDTNQTVCGLVPRLFELFGLTAPLRCLATTTDGMDFDQANSNHFRVDLNPTVMVNHHDTNLPTSIVNDNEPDPSW